MFFCHQTLTVPLPSLFLSDKPFLCCTVGEGLCKNWNLRKSNTFIKNTNLNFIIFSFPRRVKWSCFYWKYNWNQYLKKYILKPEHAHSKKYRVLYSMTQKLYRAERGPESAKKTLFRKWGSDNVDASFIEQIFFFFFFLDTVISRTTLPSTKDITS